ncbi:Glycolate dehydrogenase, FAD-binding subunit GlcE [hydrothermal vent metagenome]|uniref:Glycolate dehydrogenase, FAD-binding subunit GlcE n=1 Tax=hydrothermal vent metagenome TaxID=652676 RepID=A0A1W1DP08_9ZZZZ
MSERIEQLQAMIKQADSLHLCTEMLDYSGIIEYYPEELVMTAKAGTPIAEIQATLAENNQALAFFTEDQAESIGAAYANGGQDLSDYVLGVKIIDGNGELLNFGGQVMKNVAGYDVSRLLVGSKGQLALVTQISFKVLPKSYIAKLTAPIKSTASSSLRQQIEQKLKQVFDPRGVFN